MLIEHRMREMLERRIDAAFYESIMRQPTFHGSSAPVPLIGETIRTQTPTGRLKRLSEPPIHNMPPAGVNATDSASAKAQKGPVNLGEVS